MSLKGKPQDSFDSEMNIDHANLIPILSSSSTNRFDCQNCRQSFNTISKLKYHRLKIHGKWSKKVWNCAECEKVGHPKNATVSEYGNRIFWHDGQGVDYCLRYPLLANMSVDAKCSKESFNYNITNKTDMVECYPDVGSTNIIYGKFGMKLTVVTEFDLVCKDEYKVLFDYNQ